MKKKKVLQIRLDDYTYDELKELAWQLDMSLSECVRDSIKDRSWHTTREGSGTHFIVEGKAPKCCLHCRFRHVIYEGYDEKRKGYQMCGLCPGGWASEAWFKTEDLTEDFISEHCPIVGVIKM